MFNLLQLLVIFIVMQKKGIFNFMQCIEICMCVRELSFNELHTLLIMPYKLPKYYSLKHAFLSPLNPPTNTINILSKQPR